MKKIRTDTIKKRHSESQVRLQEEQEHTPTVYFTTFLFSFKNVSILLKFAACKQSIEILFHIFKYLVKQ